jgi:hypothetical protein
LGENRRLGESTHKKRGVKWISTTLIQRAAHGKVESLPVRKPNKDEGL